MFVLRLRHRFFLAPEIAGFAVGRNQERPASFSESSAWRQDSMRACSLAARSCSACCCDVSGVAIGLTGWREEVLLQPATNSAASGITRSVSEIFTISVHEVGIFSPDSRRVLFILQYMNNDILLVF